jgi:hypothetical protein
VGLNIERTTSICLWLKMRMTHQKLIAKERKTPDMEFGFASELNSIFPLFIYLVLRI